MMLSLTYPNDKLSRIRLDWVGCGCSSSRCGISLVASWSRKYRWWCRGPESLLCRHKVASRGVCSAYMPDTVNKDVRDLAPEVEGKSKFSSPISVSSLLEVVADDLNTLNKNLENFFGYQSQQLFMGFEQQCPDYFQFSFHPVSNAHTKNRDTIFQKYSNNLQFEIVGTENPVLASAAEQIFGAGGKRLRPALVFLVSRATAKIAGLQDLTPQHRRLAEIIEMIHTASLIHDDVLDDSGMRRGKETIHKIYGTRVAVLAGDFMFAQSSWYLANLENLEVIKLISQVIKDFASGEIKQASSLFDCDLTLDEYLLKSYYKTASLISASTKAAAIFSGVSESICEQMFDYGKNLGLSFQVVDDILDFTQSAEQLGKPAASDLAKGNLTAPVIFALEKEPKLREIIDYEFGEEGSLHDAIDLVFKCGGIKKARNLAKDKADLAISKLQCLPPDEFRSSLEGMVEYNLKRID